MTSTATETPRREPLLDTDRAAERMGISRQTLAIWRVKGYGPAYIKMGSRVLYDPSDIDTWIHASRRRSTSDRSAA